MGVYVEREHYRLETDITGVVLYINWTRKHIYTNIYTYDQPFGLVVRVSDY